MLETQSLEIPIINPDENNEGTAGGDNSGSNSEEDTNSGENESDKSQGDTDNCDTEKETGATEGESVSDNETKSISVSFDANGGILESETDAKQIHIGESYGTLPTASRENFRGEGI